MDIIPGAVVTGAHLKRPPNPPNGKSGNRLELTCPAKKKKSRRLSISSGFLVFGLGVVLTADKSEVRQGLCPTESELIQH